MAGNKAKAIDRNLAMNSHQTALCIIPTADQCREFDRLRGLYDKSHGKWPPHINLIYPFVAVEDLPQATELLQAALASRGQSPRIRLDNAGYFSQRNGYTVYLGADTASDIALDSLRKEALKTLGQPYSACSFHLTIGQSADQSTSARDFLMSKAALLPAAEFKVGELVILVREHNVGSKGAESYMKLWGTLNLSQPSAPMTEFWLHGQLAGWSDDEVISSELMDTLEPTHLTSQTTYQCESGNWKPVKRSNSTLLSEHIEKEFTVATYNVLADAEFPPLCQRDPDLLRTILSNAAKADILVLEEVTDSFLSTILTDEDVLRHYAYSSHGPSCQNDIGPLPSLRNIVILSRRSFTWSYLPFHRRHKGAVIAQMDSIGVTQDSTFYPLVIAGVHLTSGLTDGSVATKSVQVGRLLKYLQRECSMSPWIVAGDFNLTTSAMTIDTAIRDASISEHTALVLASIETELVQAGLLDSWALARVDATDDSSFASQSQDHDDIFEGEDGATFDPRENALAAESSGTSKNRPQRYDRILIKDQGAFSVSRFNKFGMATDSTEQIVPVVWPVPSDHYGIRAMFRRTKDNTVPKEVVESVQLSPLHIQALKGNLSLGSSLVSTLEHHGMLPSEDETNQRQEAFSTLERILKGDNEDKDAGSHLLLEITAVGSYELKVWTTSSDVDCLCIGNISSKTFFKLARQRLRRAAAEGVSVLRKVEANSGTMLELLVKGVYMDLQYCPATKVAENWSKIATMPASDPTFDLSILSLRKLKPYRDLAYIKKTLPDAAAFRLAYRCIKLWAVQNGLYSSKFGYIGGIHINLMLTTVCKRVAHQLGHVTAENLIGTFFQSFASFDWANEMVYDPFFHKSRPRYHRTAREPMVVLGYYAPNANVAHTSIAAGLQVLVKEFKRASARLSEPSMTWGAFFEHEPAAISISQPGFLRAYDDYIRIDVQYWGRSLREGKSLVGWLESRCLVVVVDIQKALPGVEVRIWPARFTSDESTSDLDYQGCYLIGLSKHASEAAETTPQRHIAKNQFETIIKRFEYQLRSDEKYYDSSKAWIGVNLVKRREVTELHLDERIWGEHEAEEDLDSADEELEVDVDDVDEPITRLLPIVAASSGRKPSGSGKLRPAADVLNRLRWDPSLVLSDYIVGYEDRFLGAKETTLEKWKTEKTDEEFIPQHRILYFRRKSDGAVVWDRKARVDSIFGSGG